VVEACIIGRPVDPQPVCLVHTTKLSSIRAVGVSRGNADIAALPPVGKQK
jgi:hypothetical protein